MINTLSKINLSKIGWQGGRSTSIWIMSLNIMLLLFEVIPYLFLFFGDEKHLFKNWFNNWFITRYPPPNTGPSILIHD